MKVRYEAQAITATRWFVYDAATDSVVGNQTDMTVEDAKNLASELNRMGV